MGSGVGMGGAAGMRGQIKWDYGIGIGGIWGGYGHPATQGRQRAISFSPIRTCSRAQWAGPKSKFCWRLQTAVLTPPRCPGRGGAGRRAGRVVIDSAASQ